jgi:hypothetical protein
MTCSIHIDESATHVVYCMVVTSSVYLSLKSWTVCLTVWTNDARCTILEMEHLSAGAWTETESITVAAQCFTSYKYLFRLALITISHSIVLTCLGFTFLTLGLRTMEVKRGTKRSRSPYKEGSSSPSSAKTPPPAPSGSPPPRKSLPEVSSRRPYLPVFE